jgi:CTP synthase (UTP-ammonia lyase)
VTRTFRIALIGDYNPSVIAHAAIPPALELAAKSLRIVVQPEWVHTSSLSGTDAIQSLRQYHGIWCVPASPYANTEGALAAISLARTEPIPFLGTCGGFQHALLEYFRNALGVADAVHAELNPEAEHPLISRLSCPLVEVTGAIRLSPGSLAHKLYGTDQAEEGFHCNYGFNPEFTESLREREDLQIEATDDSGEIRIVRLTNHPFFVATLFQPERSSFRGVVHPLIHGFLAAAAGQEAAARAV